MAKRTAAHRGHYKAKSKPPAPMPVLLRRALAQLRGDPPESWPKIGEGFSSHYPFPMWVQMCAPHLNDSTPRADLIAMLTRLNRAEIGGAWNTLEGHCAAEECDPGHIMLPILTDAVKPWHAMSLAARTGMQRRVIAAAQELLNAIEEIRGAGAHINDLLPAEQRDPKAFLSLVQHMSAQSVGAARHKQIRGTKRQRIALYIAHKLRPVSGISTAVTIANAATGARITAKALTKPSKYPDCRGYHGRLRVVATKEEASRVLALWQREELTRQK